MANSDGRSPHGKDYGDGFVDLNSMSTTKRKRKLRLVRHVVIIAVSVVFLFSGAAMIYLDKVASSFNNVKNSSSVASSSSSASSDTSSKTPDGISLDANGNELLVDPMVLNVLLFGADSYSSSGRSDSVILLSLDSRHKKIKLTSFMRDLLVTIPDYYGDGTSVDTKLNAAYATGGPEMAIRTIQLNFGIKIDRYAIVDFSSFKQIIDTLGGIDIELTEEEIQYINWQSHHNKQVSTPNEIPVVAGVTHLNGRQALWHARNRGDDEINNRRWDETTQVFEGDDFDRVDRQRQIINVLMSEFKDASLVEIVEIVRQIGPMITTNFSQAEIVSLVANPSATPEYLKYDMKEFRLPNGEYGVDWKYGEDQFAGSVLEILDLNKLRYNLAKFIFEESVVSDSSAQ